ncbi:hypothetical protein A9G49_18485 [Aeromonas sp. ANP5]|nr:hypothetical protein A9G04_15775 [Aeromonas sp. ANNP30]OEC62635.1 hypothetical protein A9G49_18485 [Aeromonas sp. ANP5]
MSHLLNFILAALLFFTHQFQVSGLGVSEFRCLSAPFRLPHKPLSLFPGAIAFAVAVLIQGQA